MKKYLVAWTVVAKGLTPEWDKIEQRWGVYDNKEDMMKACTQITSDPDAVEYYATEILIHMPFNGH